MTVDARVSSVLWYGSGRRGGGAQRTLVRRIRLPALRRAYALHRCLRRPHPVPVPHLPPPDLADRGNILRQHQAAVDALVPGDALDQPSPNRPVGPGDEAATRREPPDCLVAAPQDEPRHGRAYLPPSPTGFNLRFVLRDVASRRIVDVSRCAPIREQVLRQHAEACF